MGAYFRIVLPLTTPGIVAISVNSFLVCWSEYLMSSVFVKTEKLRTVTVMLQFFREESYSDWGALLAAACIASIPALLILLFGQKYIISGIAAGAVKE
jgi:ABC-type glycerol-3-phosphate transport system permease component